MYRRLIILSVIILFALCGLTMLGYHAIEKWAQGLEGARLGEFAGVAEQIREDVKRKLDEFMQTGERIHNLKRMFCVKRGISGKDDVLPARFLTQRLPSGGTKGNIFHLGAMLNDYYTIRGWDEDGIPTRKKLTELGLEWCL